MANAVRGDVSFTVGDETFTMRWSTGAMCHIEEATGRGVVTIGRELMSWVPPVDGKGKPVPETRAQEDERLGRIRLSSVRVIFLGMLRERHPTMTIEQAGDLMDAIGGMSDVMTLINKAFERGSAPETKDARPPEGEAMQKNGTGIASSSTGSPMGTTKKRSGTRPHAN